MAGFSQKDQENLLEILQNYVDEEVVFGIAKSFTKNVMAVTELKAAYDIIFLHGGNIRTILNKRHITKDILFKYLHCNKYPVRAKFTKQSLIEDVIAYWAQREPPDKSTDDNTHSFAKEQNECGQTVLPLDSTEHFPINLMARQFTKWFFLRYNSNELITADFWLDAVFHVKIHFEDGIDEKTASTSEDVLNTLNHVRNDSQLYFNACTLHQGCQGRIDIHGLVLVLACGTIHTPELCVGVFEAVFKLTRDPFAENNWKIKATEFILRSTVDALTKDSFIHSSDTMKNLLALPVPSGDI